MTGLRAFWEAEESERVRWLRLAATTFAILALELALIRWIGSQIRVFAYFANLVLIAGFLGMGLGIAAGRRHPDLVRAALPLLAVLAALLAFSPQIGLTHLKFGRSIHLWGAEREVSSWTILGSAAILLAIFWLVVAVFLAAAAPVGWLFDRLAPLTAYSADLFGSLLGVIALAVLAALHTSPVVWMIVVSLPLLAMAPRGPLLLAAAAILVFAALSIRGARFSPYSRLDLERRAPAGGAAAGAEGVLSANRDFHQYLYDLSEAAVRGDPVRARLQAVYELPFRVRERQGRSALVVGSGAGNDVAAALRRGFEHVTSVEIDPLILEIGRRTHPERPYSDPRVLPVVNDARAYFEQNPNERFDVVCYGLLDSHTLFSSMSSLRLENYVYSVEGIRSGWEHVAPGGVLSICFSVERPWMSQRLLRLIQEATGFPPIVILHGMASGVTFLVPRGAGPMLLPTDLGPVIRRARSDPSVRVPTDDWPFLYLQPGAFPSAYVVMLAAILLTSWLAIRKAYDLSGKAGGAMRIDVVFFLMGMAFLLLEARAVTALSLLFGSTWVVNASVFAGILTTAFLANLAVARRPPGRTSVWFLPLVLSLLATWVFTPGRLNRLPLVERGIVAGLLYALPVAFAGVIFSSLLAGAQDPTRALGSNLLGAVLGGMLEYSSMLLGLRNLVLLATTLYLGACLVLVKRARQTGAAGLPAAILSG